MMNQHATPPSPSSALTITVNGQTQPLEASCSVADLLLMRGLHERRVAVMVNGDIVPRLRHGQHALHNGDTVEIISLAGGG